MAKKFKLDGSGFKIKFKNGYRVSVQFGPYNYCGNQKKNCRSSPLVHAHESDDCECAVITPSGEFYDNMEWGDDVKGWISPEEVLELLNTVSKL